MNLAPKGSSFFQDIKGNIALTAAIGILPIMAGIGAAIDYTMVNRVQAALQNAADGAALASARELGLANSKSDTIQKLAQTYTYNIVLNSMAFDESQNELDIKATVAGDKSGVQVDIAYYWTPFILHYISQEALPIRVSAKANLAGTGMVCMVGLDETKKRGIYLTKKAQLNAAGCGVYSNSSDKEGIKVEDNAQIVSGITCSAGGVKGSKKASFLPEPVTDCPRITDPLAGRSTPAVGGCDHVDLEIDSGTHVLSPGTYCKGLKVKKTAKVTLNPGIYVITGDKLEVTDKAAFEGENVGFFLSGDKAKLVFKKETTINLTAPKDGIMAGLLIFEDRTASKIEKHEITSDNARMLLGTIYLPNGTLKIDSEAPVADKAAYTAIIARSIELQEGPTLYLNSDYEATDVPVPSGLIKDEVFLSR